MKCLVSYSIFFKSGSWCILLEILQPPEDNVVIITMSFVNSFLVLKILNNWTVQLKNAWKVSDLISWTFQVMPPLWCRLDRLWFPHPGVLPGTMTRQPFICPLDHVFEVTLTVLYLVLYFCLCSFPHEMSISYSLVMIRTQIGLLHSNFGLVFCFMVFLGYLFHCFKKSSLYSLLLLSPVFLKNLKTEHI